VLIPEQEEKLASKAIVLKKLEEVGLYYALYKKTLKDGKGAKQEDNKQEEESKVEPSLALVSQLVVLLKIRGPMINDHFSKKEQEVFQKLL